MRIGILAHDFLTWQGGADFLDIVSRALLAAPGNPRLFLLLPLRGPKIFARSLRLALRHWIRGIVPGWTWQPPSRDYERSELASLPLQVKRVWIDTGKFSLLRAALRHRLDVLLPAVHSLGSDFPVPWMGYAYDFQHRHLPQFFSSKDRASRDSHFRAIFNDPTVVLVNSQTVADDARRFVEMRKARTRALPFTPMVRPAWQTFDPTLSARYQLPPGKTIFLVSNQFWPHKNHRVVLEAASILRTKTRSFQVLCTGAMNTPETHPVAEKLFSDFRHLLEEQTVRFLGWIPKMDQVGLFRTAAAIIQPSRFEGGPGGGAAYHAAALGRPLILSDIPVNREVRTDSKMFFPPSDAVALAKLMEQLISSPLSPPPPWEILQQRSDEAAMVCGQALITAAREAVDLFKARVGG